MSMAQLNPNLFLIFFMFLPVPDTNLSQTDLFFPYHSHIAGAFYDFLLWSPPLKNAVCLNDVGHCRTPVLSLGLEVDCT